MNNNSLSVAAAIVIAGALIAVAVYLTGQGGGQTNTEPIATLPDEIPMANETDNILGNPNAPIVIIEYLDYNCPHCTNFHFTMKRIMNRYGLDGKVAWVNRHFPLEALYPNSFELAMAAECVAGLAGNAAFWDFSNLIFENRGEDELADVSHLNEFAAEVGVDENKFNNCLSSETYKEKIETQFAIAQNNGAKGTPYVVLAAGGQSKAVEGNINYQSMAGIIEELLKQLSASGVIN